MAHPLDVAPLLTLRDGYGDREESEAIRLFAEANGARFWPLMMDQPLPGVVFRDATGASRHLQGAGRIVRFPGEPEIEIANSGFQHAIDLNVMSSGWGYAAVRPSRPAPALLVETASARAVRLLPAIPTAAETLTLGGAEAYVDARAAHWARGILRPDLLALLDDPGLPFDLEIVEGWLFLYSPRQLSVADPRVWRRTLGVVAAVHEAVEAADGAGVVASGVPVGLPMTDRPWKGGARKALWIYGSLIAGMAVVGGCVALFAR
ncbi:acetyl-CoA carboxylase, carboxyltransferase component [Microbacterium testaceum StLB037]|uniref:Acetyl-CoA carboxylase, carboxyltransferase component n=1 Tax=Microbacterium testaceum (strain StLB037) TaxID=979556 RepID=E8N776_MICTS|nr:hypothetical protein [Microbacterium testaceum]BAJ75508.1 acetyl-CoA carboxylase, carboxyltransferase component [Microbacterium testaceum StLB037]